MRRQAAQLFETKLRNVLRAADDAALFDARTVCAEIGPAPSCPFVGDVMRHMQQAFARGHVAREQAAQSLVSETVSAYEKLLNSQFIGELLSAIERAFPPDHFVEFARSTKGTYARRLAPARKFDERVFANELSLISVSASNMSRQAVSRLRTSLNDSLLRRSVNGPSLWGRIAAVLWRYVAAPSAKWLFSIFSAVLIASLLAYFGLK